MFYEDVGLLPAICVFFVVIGSYRLVTYLTGKSKWVEQLLEGKSELLVEDGVFSVLKFQKQDIAQDEFFSELRLKSIEHLGQVKYAFLEPSGNISVFYFADDKVRPGLPLIPSRYHRKSKTIPHEGLFSCANCGYTQRHSSGHAVCPTCHKDEWVEAVDSIRIT
jgi:uncharacterized membrane protein YcaP (DUF421 family)